MAISGLGGGDVDEFDEGFNEINITPLTDVFLVMLIIFFLAAVISVDSAEKANAQLEKDKRELSDALAKAKELNIKLPSGGLAGEASGDEMMTVMVTKKGGIFLNGTEVTPAKLTTEFQRAYIKNPKTRLTVQADKGVAHGTVVQVLGLAHRQNLTQIIIATD